MLLQGDTTAHLLGWPKSRALTTQNAGEGVEPQELSRIAGGDQSSTTTLEHMLVVSYKTQHTPTIWSSHRAPWYLPK
jgi:hypothetical protein